MAWEFSGPRENGGSDDVRPQLRILRLAAEGSALRASLTDRQLKLAPSLAGALEALDRVLIEMGFGDD